MATATKKATKLEVPVAKAAAVGAVAPKPVMVPVPMAAVRELEFQLVTLATMAQAASTICQCNGQHVQITRERMDVMADAISDVVRQAAAVMTLGQRVIVASA